MKLFARGGVAVAVVSGRGGKGWVKLGCGVYVVVVG